MVILPVRNEGPRVGLVVRELERTLPGVELVVIENGSTDDTAERARAAGATVLQSDPGYANAPKVGFAYAQRREAAWPATVGAARRVRRPGDRGWNGQRFLSRFPQKRAFS